MQLITPSTERAAGEIESANFLQGQRQRDLRLQQLLAKECAIEGRADAVSVLATDTLMRAKELLNEIDATLAHLSKAKHVQLDVEQPRDCPTNS